MTAIKDKIIIRFKDRMNRITKSIQESAEKNMVDEIISYSSMLEDYMNALRWLESYYFVDELTEEKLMRDIKYYNQYERESLKINARYAHMILMEKIYLETGMLPTRNFYKGI